MTYTFGYATNPVTIRNEWTVKCVSCNVNIGRFSSEIFEDDEGGLCIRKQGGIDAINAWNKRKEKHKKEIDTIQDFRRMFFKKSLVLRKKT